MWDAKEGLLTETFTALNVYIRKKRFKINNLSFYSRTLEKEEQFNTKSSRRKEIKIKAYINKIENRKSI